jgi:hypothetical protein
MRKKLLIGAATVAAACITGVAAAGGLSGSEPQPATGAVAAGDAIQAESSAPLPSFSSCMGLLAYAKSNALDLVGPYGLSGVAFPYAVPAAEEAAPPAEDAGAAAPTRNDFSGTNVQEEGVDEPDIVKTDGNVVYAVAQGNLNAVDISGPLPVLLGSLPLGEGFGHQLLLSGNRLLVIATTGFFFEPLPAVASDIMPPSGVPSTILSEVDVSNPAAMQIVRTMTLEANYVSARLVGSVARLVTSSTPMGLQFAYPESDKPAAIRAAERRNRAVIRGSKVDNWVPGYTLMDARTGKTTTKSLLTCRQVRHPAEFSGLGMLTVLTLDLAQGIEPIDTDAVMAGGDMVYASTQGLYVATQQWVDPVALEDPSATPPSVTTAIHKFDISNPTQTEYRGSGEVTGYLLNQWSLSENNGFLRVVSTDAPSWWGGEESETESLVSVLAEQEGRLATVGQLGGLGRGERVYAVRFIGDLGYVVTFRQVDPLHVIDVSDPANPVLRGELHIPGYSAYLHPIGDGLLLGVGHDATPDGRVLGTQVSVFDVTSPDNPVQVHKLQLGEGWSEVEFDHHAFLYWPPSGLAVLPLERWSFDEATGVSNYTAVAVGLLVGRGGILQVGSVEHESTPSGDPEFPLYATPIRRSVVAGNALYTVSELGLKASDLLTLADQAWVSFGTPEPPPIGIPEGEGSPPSSGTAK